MEEYILWKELPFEIRKKYMFEFQRYIWKNDSNFENKKNEFCKKEFNKLYKRIEKNDKLKKTEAKIMYHRNKSMLEDCFSVLKIIDTIPNYEIFKKLEV